MSKATATASDKNQVEKVAILANYARYFAEKITRKFLRHKRKRKRKRTRNTVKPKRFTKVNAIIFKKIITQKPKICG